MTEPESRTAVRAVSPEELGKVAYAAWSDWARDQSWFGGPARPWAELTETQRTAYERMGVAVLKFAVRELTGLALHDPDRDDGDDPGGGPVGVVGPGDAA